MTSIVRYLTPKTTYGDLQTLLTNEPNLKALPIVESKENMILLGSCSRTKLLQSLNRKVGEKARQAEAIARLEESFEEVERRFRPISEDQLQIASSIRRSSSRLDLESADQTMQAPNKMSFYYTDRPEVEDEPATTRKLSR
jgi:hypothetical protein